MFKSNQRVIAISLIVLIIILAKWGDRAQSQEKYPTRPIDLIVAFSPGGSADLSARLIATYMSKKWGIPINVVNKPGGNTIPGVLEVYRASPDGYTMLLDATSTSSVLGASVPNLPFKIMDRTFINRAIYCPNLIFVSFSSPFKTLEDFVNFAKKNPEKVTWDNFGGSSTSDFCLRQLFKDIGVDVLKTKPVPVKGGSEAVALVSGGHVMVGSITVPTIIPAVKGNLVRAVLMSSEQRFPLLPDVPTSIELGYPKNIFGNWVGISGPPKLPSHIVEKWDKDMQEMLKDPEVISKSKDLGGIPIYRSAPAIKDIILKEMEAIEGVMEK